MTEESPPEAAPEHTPEAATGALRVALQMDAVETLKPQSDSTLLLGLEAQRRGYELYYYTPDRLSWRDGRITAAAHRLTLYPEAQPHYALGEALMLELSDMNVVLLRQDPPFNMAYLTTTYLLEQLPQTLVVNRPASVRNHPEKLFPALLRRFMPPTLVTADSEEIRRFRREHGDIVIKPLYGFGGHGVFRLRPQDGNFDALMEMIFAGSREPWVAQPFLPQVATGERRVIMIDGQVGGVIARLPAAGEIRANMRVGGQPQRAELTPRQQEICAALGPLLQEKGLILAGVDLIGDYLIEVNITSPTGLVAMNRLYGLTLEADIWDAMEARLTL